MNESIALLQHNNIDSRYMKKQIVEVAMFLIASEDAFLTSGGYFDFPEHSQVQHLLTLKSMQPCKADEY